MQVWQDSDDYGYGDEWLPVADTLNEQGREGWEVVGIFGIELVGRHESFAEGTEARRARQEREGYSYGWALLKRPTVRV